VLDTNDPSVSDATVDSTAAQSPRTARRTSFMAFDTALINDAMNEVWHSTEY
jgi:hypothetical protein